MVENKVSVIIPCFNSQNHLEECVSSVLNQKYCNIEIILVNDGSKDNTSNICRKLSEQNSCITFLEQENSGVSSARNLGLSVATGEFICFVDSDDFVSKEYVSILVSEMNDKKVNAVFMPFSYYYFGRILARKMRIKEGIHCFNDIECGFIDDGTVSGFMLGSVCCALYKKDVIESNQIRFREGVSTNEDGIFNLEYLRKAKSFYVLDNPENYFYRREWKEYSRSFDNVIVKKGRLEYTDKVLYEINQELLIDKFEKQMLTRKNTEFMFLMVELQRCNLPFDEFLKYTSRINKMYVCDDSNIIPWSEMSIYKRCFLKVSMKKKSFLLSIIMYYIYPIIMKRVKR